MPLEPVVQIVTEPSGANIVVDCAKAFSVPQIANAAITIINIQYILFIINPT